MRLRFARRRPGTRTHRRDTELVAREPSRQAYNFDNQRAANPKRLSLTLVGEKTVRASMSLWRATSTCSCLAGQAQGNTQTANACGGLCVSIAGPLLPTPSGRNASALLGAGNCGSPSSGYVNVRRGRRSHACAQKKTYVRRQQ